MINLEDKACFPQLVIFHYNKQVIIIVVKLSIIDDKKISRLKFWEIQLSYQIVHRLISNK